MTATVLVLDSTTLINLAKAELLEAVGTLPERCMVAETVYGETVVAGHDPWRSDALAVEQAIAAGHLERCSDVDPNHMLAKTPLRPNDAKVLAQAADLGARLGSDDRRLRSVARVMGIPVGGTGYLLGRLMATGTLTRTQARISLDILVAAGWWCSIDTYRKILGRIEGFN